MIVTGNWVLSLNNTEIIITEMLHLSFIGSLMSWMWLHSESWNENRSAFSNFGERAVEVTLCSGRDAGTRTTPSFPGQVLRFKEANTCLTSSVWLIVVPRGLRSATGTTSCGRTWSSYRVELDFWHLSLISSQKSHVHENGFNWHTQLL